MISRRTILGLALLVVLAAAGLQMLRSHRPVPVAPVDTGVEPVGLALQPIHELRSEKIAAGQRYWIGNLVDGPIEVECRFRGGANVSADPSLPQHLVLAPRSERALTSLHAIDPTQKSYAGISCDAIVGDPEAVADQGVVYALPFDPGTEFTIEQAANGGFSHHDPESRYALDLGVAEGSAVRAARDGVVMQVEDQFRGHGLDPEKFGARGNFVRIVHADGSMAVYAHLSPDSVPVHPGDAVRAGDFLGKSGNTGFTTGPHLHFAVQRNEGMALRSIPFAMAGVDPKSTH